LGIVWQEKKEAYEKADIKANAEKAKSNVKNRIVHAKADADREADSEKRKAEEMKRAGK
jgi:hypothetical protein